MNRFDDILTSVIEKYALNAGPQTKPFGRYVLIDAYTSSDGQSSSEDADSRLNALGYGPEGDRELVEAILDFSRLLLEKCGNRSLYNSSERLGELLNTTSLSLLQSTLGWPFAWHKDTILVSVAVPIFSRACWQPTITST